MKNENSSGAVAPPFDKGQSSPSATVDVLKAVTNGGHALNYALTFVPKNDLLRLKMTKNLQALDAARDALTCRHCGGRGHVSGDPEGAPIEGCDYCKGTGSSAPALQAEVERLRAVVQGFLDCPEIADCAPDDKDPETNDLERLARSLLKRATTARGE